MNAQDASQLLQVRSRGEKLLAAHNTLTQLSDRPRTLTCTRSELMETAIKTT